MLHDAVSLNSTYPPKVILNRHGTFEEYIPQTSSPTGTRYALLASLDVNHLEHHCSYPSPCPNGCKRGKCVGSSPMGPIIFNKILNPVFTDPICTTSTLSLHPPLLLKARERLWPNPCTQSPSLCAASVTWFAQRQSIDEARELDIWLDRVQICLRNDISLRTSPSLGLRSSCSSEGQLGDALMVTLEHEILST
ncbi:hypothetical protein FVEG_15633 [Fusarium verticillioides 7600]|uniref:Uncharacterized protein n=1 Tax=Gibberella moniliformis (strain M3125 / FGSC 7600) TaxID=334819 RepID=W7MA51_GIBM7|nr:hypothetical protein FVEG_15633 [Fusarium verticillioides 7600]EWG44314.1 hypothetical protein FVEG_15633 [Fusarium verticillioides 7600]